jgi:hypothetical protein
MALPFNAWGNIPRQTSLGRHIAQVFNVWVIKMPGPLSFWATNPWAINAWTIIFGLLRPGNHFVGNHYPVGTAAGANALAG